VLPINGLFWKAEILLITGGVGLPDTIEKRVTFQDSREMVAVLGHNDEFLKIMQEMPCQIIARGNELIIKGKEKDAELIEKEVGELLYLYRQGLPITAHDVKYSLQLMQSGQEEALHRLYTDTVLTTYRGKQVKAKTLGQLNYLRTIAANHITIAVGPAGTGKTYLAVAMAVKALKNREVERIILTRPAVEAGEKLGFLPGDLQEKVDPYLRPLYDALYEMLGMESFQKYLTRGTIEVAPLAYMRGRTLNDAFIILDEAQNTTSEQMRMALTRFGFGSKLVVTGDDTQVDLPAGKQSGLTNAAEVLQNIPGIGIVYFTEKDVIRHEIVAAIIKAYQKYDDERARERKDRKERKERRDERHDRNAGKQSRRS
jgi:phosphate starvation-inducible PhoH-like protein